VLGSSNFLKKVLQISLKWDFWRTERDLNPDFGVISDISYLSSH